jgi:hypothetical protein
MAKCSVLSLLIKYCGSSFEAWTVYPLNVIAEVTFFLIVPRKNYGAEVNLFVDHSQIVQLECLRSGIWGTKSLWGRILTYKG